MRSGDTFVLASGGAVTGTFDSIDAGDRNVEVTYSDTQVKAVIQ